MHTTNLSKENNAGVFMEEGITQLLSVSTLDSAQVSSTLQEYVVVTLSPLVALKEGKVLCAPLAQYSEEGVPTVAILHLSAVCDFVTVLVTSVWLKVQKYTTSAMCGDNKCVLVVYRAGAMYCDVRYRCVIQLYTHTIGIGSYVLYWEGWEQIYIYIQHNRRTIIL